MKMDFLSRRDFAKKSVAYAAVGANAAFAQSKEIPVLRIGILSDLHYRTFDNGKGLQNCLGIESTLRYLDRRKVDGVVACGDITDFGTAEALRQLGKLWFKVFPDNRRSDGEKIKPLFLMGDHDMGGYALTGVPHRDVKAHGRFVNRPYDCARLSLLPLTRELSALAD